MLVALLAGLLPVALGVGLALTPMFRRGLRGPAAAFAIAIALSVVLGDLLPESGDAIGWWALVWLGAGLLGPGLLERIGARMSKGRSVGAEMGFAALCVHQIMDGLQVGAGLTLGESGWAIVTAVGAHSVPLVGAVTLGFVQRDGPKKALLRGVGLLFFTAVGVAGGELGVGLVANLGWLPALIGGLLLHVLWHDLWEAPPSGVRARSVELGAFVLGASLPLLLLHEEPGAFHASLSELSAELAPALLIGLALAAALQALGTDLPGRPGLLRGAFAASILPVNECSVLPQTQALTTRGAAPPTVLGFLLMTPALGLETLIVSGALLGPPMAIARFAIAALAALGGALVIFGPGAEGEARSIPISTGSYLLRLRVALSETLLHTGPWVVAGLVLAAAVDAFLPPLDAASAMSPAWLILVLLAIPLFVSATAAIPLAAVLWAKGVPAEIVLAVLVIGPALNQANLAFVQKTWGLRGSAATGVFVLIGVGLAYGFAPAHPTPIGASALELPALSILTVLLLVSAWNVGPRGWLAVLSDLGGPGTGHDHGHDHGHAHEHVHRSEGLGPVAAAHAGEIAHDHCHDHELGGSEDEPPHDSDVEHEHRR